MGIIWLSKGLNCVVQGVKVKKGTIFGWQIDRFVAQKVVQLWKKMEKRKKNLHNICYVTK